MDKGSEILIDEKWVEGIITFIQILGGGDTKIFSAKFSHDDKYIACGNKFSNNL